LTLRRRDNKFYKQVHSQVLQDVLLRLDKACQAFFNKSAKFPKFKKPEKYNAFTYPQYGGFQIKNNRLVLSFIGAVRIRMHRIPVGTLKTCTIFRDVDQWYACLSSDDGIDFTERGSHENAVGVDLGLIRSIVLSTGEMIENPKHLKQSAHRLRKLQRSLDRKQKGSRNRAKARVKLAKAWRRVRNQRMDHVHKVTTKLAAKYDTVIFEALKINNMVKNHNLASAIMDATWSKLRLYTAYKVEGRGGRVILVNPNGTSQKCSGCGWVVQKDLSERIHQCPACNLVIDRDHNAALNILNLGLEQARAEAEPLLVRRISKFSLGSKKPAS
jgi:putative transposase